MVLPAQQELKVPLARRDLLALLDPLDHKAPQVQPVLKEFKAFRALSDQRVRKALLLLER